MVGEVSPGVGNGELKYLLTVVFGLVSIDVVVLVGGDPLGRGVLDAGFVLRLRHFLQTGSSRRRDHNSTGCQFVS